MDGLFDSYWATDDDVTSAQIELDLQKEETINYIVLQEYIALGQRIKAFSVEAMEDGQWKEISKGTTIGYKRILKISPISAQKIRIRLIDSKASPVISHIALY